MRRGNHRGVAFWVVAALPLVGSPALPQPRPVECPDPETVEAKLQEGVRYLYSRAQRPEAEAPLCEAACCLSDVDPTRRVSVRGFLYQYAAPFYHLGVFYSLEEDRPCSALKNLNLSECRGEMRPEEVRDRYGEELAARRREARRRKTARGADDVRSFHAGQQALHELSYAEAAERFWQAIGKWDEDGEDVRGQGRFPDRYLPRYHLARSLLGLGCWESAAAVARSSHLGWCHARRDHVGERLAEVLDRAMRAISNGEPEGEGCSEWNRRIPWEACSESIPCVES